VPFLHVGVGSISMMSSGIRQQTCSNSSDLYCTDAEDEDVVITMIFGAATSLQPKGSACVAC